MNPKAIKISQNNISIANKPKINIKLLADIHFCSSFKTNNLDLINKALSYSQTDYLCIPGDILDNTSFLETDKEKRQQLIKWFKYLGKNYKVFICLGNHDISGYQNNNCHHEETTKFWDEVSKIPGVNLMSNDTTYEDGKIIIKSLNPGYEYYYKNFKQEDIGILKEKLIFQQKHLKKTHSNKLKVLLIHSPIHITNKEILPLIKEYNLILSGHMHNGVVLPIFDELIKTNKGLISPFKNLFPDNARGVKEISVNNKKIYLIVTGGITKIQECAPKLLRPFNILYPMSINNIKINYTSKNKNTYKYYFF